MGREALLPAAADHRRIVGRAFAGVFAAHHCYRSVRVFQLERGRKAESIVANGGLLPMPSQRVLFMGRVKRRDWVKRQKMDRRIQIMWMKNKEPGAKKSFCSSGLSVPCARGTRSCSECWLEHWCKGLIMIWNNFGATNKLFRNWGACVDTIFWHVSRKMMMRRKGCRFERN